MTRSSPRVFVVVDPPQDYEESLRILGVHGTLTAAKVATAAYRRRRLPPSGPGAPSWPLVDPHRHVEVQLWHGDRQLDTWTHSPTRHDRETGRPSDYRWMHTPGPDPRP